MADIIPILRAALRRHRFDIVDYFGRTDWSVVTKIEHSQWTKLAKLGLSPSQCNAFANTGGAWMNERMWERRLEGKHFQLGADIFAFFLAHPHRLPGAIRKASVGWPPPVRCIDTVFKSPLGDLGVLFFQRTGRLVHGIWWLDPDTRPGMPLFTLFGEVECPQ